MKWEGLDFSKCSWEKGFTVRRLRGGDHLINNANTSVVSDRDGVQVSNKSIFNSLNPQNSPIAKGSSTTTPALRPSQPNPVDVAMAQIDQPQRPIRIFCKPPSKDFNQKINSNNINNKAGSHNSNNSINNHVNNNNNNNDITSSAPQSSPHVAARSSRRRLIEYTTIPTPTRPTVPDRLFPVSQAHLAFTILLYEFRIAYNF